MKTTRSIIALALAFLLAACGANERDAPAGQGHAEAAHGHEPAHGEEDEAPHTEIPAEIAARSGIRTAAAGPGTIADEHEIQGLLTPVEGRVSMVAARFPGPIRSLRASVGDRVRAGQPLATIGSNLSLTDYTVSAPITGVVLERYAEPGMVASEGTALYEIADLDELWVDLHIFGADAQHIRAGAPVAVTRIGDGAATATTLARILPGAASASQSTVGRATVRNADGLWRPGSAVKARVTVELLDADLVVPLTALQLEEAGEVVYVREGETYTARPVKVGRRDAARAEILAGLAPGEEVVVEQSFLVKADIGKSSAGHDH